jgi:hypothetical protein
MGDGLPRRTLGLGIGFRWIPVHLGLFSPVQVPLATGDDEQAGVLGRPVRIAHGPPIVVSIRGGRPERQVLSS